MKKIDTLSVSGENLADHLLDRLDGHSPYTERLGNEAPLNQGHLPKDFKPIHANLFPEGRVYPIGDTLCIENLAKIPVHRCIKTNLPAKKVIRVHLRNPMRPDTWWGKQRRRLNIGLSETALLKYRLLRAFSCLCLPAAMGAFAGGIFISLWLFLLPIPLVILAGLTNSVNPVSAREVSREFTSVKGVSIEYLRELP